MMGRRAFLSLLGMGAVGAALPWDAVVYDPLAVAAPDAVVASWEEMVRVVAAAVERQMRPNFVQSRISLDGLPAIGAMEIWIPPHREITHRSLTKSADYLMGVHAEMRPSRDPLVVPVGHGAAVSGYVLRGSNKPDAELWLRLQLASEESLRRGYVHALSQ